MTLGITHGTLRSTSWLFSNYTTPCVIQEDIFTRLKSSLLHAIFRHPDNALYEIKFHVPPRPINYNEHIPLILLVILSTII